MRKFMDRDFLLNNPTAVTLFHDYAEKQPIIDYHCHINPAEIAEDRHFSTITEAWLGGDHYKWRIMRANGVPESCVTGDSTPYEKFEAYAAALSRAVGNPLYHWTHLELQRYFGYDGVLNEKTAPEVWELCNKKLETLSVREMIRVSNVETIVTTDDPIDTLDAHRRIREEKSCSAAVLPGWRPDKAANIAKPGFCEYLAKLSNVSGIAIHSVADVCAALANRMDYFETLGCKVSDHGLDAIPYAPNSEAVAEKALAKALAGETVSPAEEEAYQYAVLRFLGREYAKRGWIFQFHYGAVRNANSRMFAQLGPDTGYDCIGMPGNAAKIAGFLDTLEKDGGLPKTILYSLNPNDNAMLDSIIGCFQGTEAAGKIQHGSAWWFNDTKVGMEDQLTSLANLSVLGNFVGMLTDSRSFLSYARHEYFRRILCNLLGEWAESGQLPADPAYLGGIAADISYRNAKRYFGF
ncbi:MAG: glucuronate isomerase [Candidatus Merdivicinus sp.]|jgi:glucuronate isomerase